MRLRHKAEIAAGSIILPSAAIGIRYLTGNPLYAVVAEEGRRLDFYGNLPSSIGYIFDNFDDPYKALALGAGLAIVIPLVAVGGVAGYMVGEVREGVSKIRHRQNI